MPDVRDHFHGSEVAALAPEAEAVYDAKAVQKRYGAGGEELRASGGITDRKFEYGVRAAFQRHFRTEPFGHDGGNAPLYIIAAHYDDDGVGAGDPFCFLYMIEMSVVERIVFGDQASNFHKNLLVYRFLPYYTIK